MKFKLILAAAIFAVSLTPAVAGLYVGGDLNHVALQTHKGTNKVVYPENLNGGDVHLGYQINDWLGAEVGLQAVDGQNSLTSIQLRTPTIDGFAYLPVTDTLRLFGTGGVIYTDAKGTSFSKTLLHTVATNWRAGGGFEFTVTNKFNVRFTGRYEPLSLGGYEDHAVTAGVGLNFGL